MARLLWIWALRALVVMIADAAFWAFVDRDVATIIGDAVYLVIGQFFATVLIGVGLGGCVIMACLLARRSLVLGVVVLVVVFLVYPVINIVIARAAPSPAILELTTVGVLGFVLGFLDVRNVLGGLTPRLLPSLRKGSEPGLFSSR